MDVLQNFDLGLPEHLPIHRTSRGAARPVYGAAIDNRSADDRHVVCRPNDKTSVQPTGLSQSGAPTLRSSSTMTAKVWVVSARLSPTQANSLSEAIRTPHLCTIQ